VGIKAVTHATGPTAMTDAPNSIAAIITASSQLQGLFSLAIPIIAIVMGIGLAVVRVALDYRRKRELFQLHHAERMAAIEKGIEVPPLPPEFFQDYRHRTPGNYLYRGLVWLLVGLSIGMAMFASDRHDINPLLSLIPVSIGLANLLYFFLAPRLTAPPESGQRP
jgi:Domain of unknown function (DUF6249)